MSKGRKGAMLFLSCSEQSLSVELSYTAAEMKNPRRDRRRLTGSQADSYHFPDALKCSLSPSSILSGEDATVEQTDECLFVF